MTPAVHNVCCATFSAAALGYRGHVVLPSVTLEIRNGDFMVIGGPNGGGKSTLLKTLAGLVPVLGGSLVVRDFRIGYVPQQAAIEPPLPLTCFELVQLGTAASPKKQPRAFLKECLKKCEALDLAQRSFGELSGGQRQRVLIARALAVEPNILLLDEPTAGVDRNTQHVIADLLGAMNRGVGMTLVLVTHERKPFEPHATRYLAVGDGTLEEQGVPV